MRLFVCTPTPDSSRFHRDGLVWASEVPLPQYGSVVWEIEVILNPSSEQRGIKPGVSARYSQGGWWKGRHHAGYMEIAMHASCVRSYKLK